MQGTRAAAYGSATALLAACASINPTLAPARVLAQGRASIELGSGYSGALDVPALDDARTSIAQIVGGNPSPGATSSVVRAAVAHGWMPNGIASYTAMRLGLGNDVEGSVAAMGRIARLGVRRVFWRDADDVWAFSLGAAARGALTPWGLDGALPGVSVSESRLVGGDVAAVLGRTSSDLYDVYFGLRLGYTHADGAYASTSVGAIAGTAERVDAAVTLGLRVGFGHVAALVEIELMGGWVQVSSSTPGLAGSSGTPVLGLTPAAALGWAL